MDINSWNTLFRRCISYIRNNIDIILNYYRNLHIDPEIIFQEFPPNLCEILIRFISSELDPHLLSCMFRKGVRNIRLSFYSHDIPLDKFIEISQEITYFNLGFGIMTEDNLNKVISHMSNVVILDLHATNIGDSGLEIIGLTCTMLENLELSFCAVTDLGIRFLCYNSKTNNEIHCKNLKILSVYHTGITADGLAFVLGYIPLLKIEVERSIYMTMICRFVQQNFGKQLLLNDLCITTMEEPVDVVQILLSLPNITSLCLYKVSIEDSELISLSPFKNLRRLSISIRKSEKKLTFEVGIISFLRVSGQYLNVLRLNNFEYVNVYLIGQICKSLHSLSLYSIHHLYFRNEDQQAKPIFRHLEFMKIENLRGEPWDDCLPSIFSHCPKLNYLVIASTRSINDDIISNIVPFLSGVKWFSIFYCENITKTSIFWIINGISCLCSLLIWSKHELLSERDREEIQDYLFCNEMSTHFGYVNQQEEDISSNAYSANLRQMEFT